GRFLTPFLRMAPRTDSAEGSTPSRALARGTVRHLADQRTRGRAAEGAFCARTLAGALGLLDLRLRLLLLRRRLLLQRERIDARVGRRPGVAIGLVLRLLFRGLPRLREHVDVHRRGQGLPRRWRSLGICDA